MVNNEFISLCQYYLLVVVPVKSDTLDNIGDMLDAESLAKC